MHRTTLRACMILALAVALGGCNMVYSERPLFTAADAVGAPPLRPGLWTTSDPKCRVDEARPVQRWPKCAEWGLVRATDVLEFKADAKPAAWTSTEYVLASGDPRVLQTPFDDKNGSAFIYVALKPLRLDDQGRIVAFTTWTVLCGPPPPAPAPNATDKRRVTLEPLPGLEIKDDNCIAREPGPVRNAAKASQAWSATSQTQHWVRDTLP